MYIPSQLVRWIRYRDTVQVCDSRTHCGDNSDEARCEAVFLHTKYHRIVLTWALTSAN